MAAVSNITSIPTTNGVQPASKGTRVITREVNKERNQAKSTLKTILLVSIAAIAASIALSIFTTTLWPLGIASLAAVIGLIGSAITINKICKPLSSIPGNAQPVVNYGHMILSYIPSIEGQSFIVTNTEEFHQAMKKMNDSPLRYPNILADLTSRNFAFIYQSTGGSNESFGVDSVGYDFSTGTIKINYNVISQGIGTCAMGGYCTVLSFPKNVKPTGVSQDHLDFLINISNAEFARLVGPKLP